MKNNKNISFIIPAYNCEKTIEESIYSILNTNFNDGDEIIVVNDKSTDKTLEILEKLSYKNKNIKIINHNKNLGGASTRNTAIKNSKNDLIFCLDSDNILEKNSINKLKNFLISNECDIASFSQLKFFKNNIKEVSHKPKYKKSEFFLMDLLTSQRVPPASGNYLFTKQSWINSGGYPEFAGALDTWGFGFRQLATGSKMKVMPNSYYYHRYGNDSYWVRESRKGNNSATAIKIIEPYFNLIENNTLNYIVNNKYTWFDDIGDQLNILNKINKKLNNFILYINVKNIVKNIIK